MVGCLTASLTITTAPATTTMPSFWFPVSRSTTDHPTIPTTPTPTTTQPEPSLTYREAELSMEAHLREQHVRMIRKLREWQRRDAEAQSGQLALFERFRQQRTELQLLSEAYASERLEYQLIKDKFTRWQRQVQQKLRASRQEVRQLMSGVAGVAGASTSVSDSHQDRHQLAESQQRDWLDKEQRWKRENDTLRMRLAELECVKTSATTTTTTTTNATTEESGQAMLERFIQDASSA